MPGPGRSGRLKTSPDCYFQCASSLTRLLLPCNRSGKEGLQLCSALPIAAEIQAILKGSRHVAPGSADSKSCIFGCSPPPRDCTNALVRDSSFSSMRGARPTQGASAGSCSTFYHSDGVDSFMPGGFSPAASAYSTA